MYCGEVCGARSFAYYFCMGNGHTLPGCFRATEGQPFRGSCRDRGHWPPPGDDIFLFGRMVRGPILDLKPVLSGDTASA